MYINNNKLKVRRYSSGEVKFSKSNLDSFVSNGHVKILYLGKYSLFELLLVIKYYVKRNVLVDLVLSYLPYQRMDHKNRDELDTVSYVLGVFCDLGINSLTVCEPHCDIENFKNVKKFSYVDNMKDKVFKDIGFDDENDTVVLTDKGGLQRYGDISKNVVYFDKVRDENSGLIIKHNLVGNLNVKGKAVIVDDIISTGDTVVNIIEELSNRGIKDIYVLAGHIENNKYNKRIFKYENVIQVYSSNSLKKRAFNKLKLYDVFEMFN